MKRVKVRTVDEFATCVVVRLTGGELRRWCPNGPVDAATWRAFLASVEGGK